MPSGFQLFNPDKPSQPMVDTNLLLYGLVKSGELPTNNRGNITVSGVAPIVFIDGPAFLVTSSLSAGNWTFQFEALKQFPSNPNMAAIPLYPPNMAPRSRARYYIFDLMRPNKSRRGFEVFYHGAASGPTTTFNSDQWPLNIVASVLTPPTRRDSTGTERPYNNITAQQGGWSTGEIPTFFFANQVSKPLVNVGVPSGRRVAINTPWTRGGKGYGAGDSFYVWEVGIVDGSRVGFTWDVDPLVPPQFSEYPDSPIYDVYTKRIAYPLADVTNIPVPFDY